MDPRRFAQLQLHMSMFMDMCSCMAHVATVRDVIKMENTIVMFVVSVLWASWVWTTQKPAAPLQFNPHTGTYNNSLSLFLRAICQTKPSQTRCFSISYYESIKCIVYFFSNAPSTKHFDMLDILPQNLIMRVFSRENPLFSFFAVVDLAVQQSHFELHMWTYFDGKNQSTTTVYDNFLWQPRSNRC